MDIKLIKSLYLSGKIDKKRYCELLAEYLINDDEEDEPTKVRDGGEGSGNFGHAGRPGKVGGSATTGATADIDFVKDFMKNKGIKSSQLEKEYSITTKEFVDRINNWSTKGKMIFKSNEAYNEAKDLLSKGVEDEKSRIKLEKAVKRHELVREAVELLNKDSKSDDTPKEEPKKEEEEKKEPVKEKETIKEEPVKEKTVKKIDDLPAFNESDMDNFFESINRENSYDMYDMLTNALKDKQIKEAKVFDISYNNTNLGYKESKHLSNEKMDDYNKMLRAGEIMMTTQCRQLLISKYAPTVLSKYTKNPSVENLNNIKQLAKMYNDEKELYNKAKELSERIPKDNWQIQDKLKRIKSLEERYKDEDWAKEEIQNIKNEIKNIENGDEYRLPEKLQKSLSKIKNKDISEYLDIASNYDEQQLEEYKLKMISSKDFVKMMSSYNTYDNVRVSNVPDEKKLEEISRKLDYNLRGSQIAYLYNPEQKPGERFLDNHSSGTYRAITEYTISYKNRFTGETTKAINTLIENSPDIESPLYRGFAKKEATFEKSLIKAKPGKIINMPTPRSFSTDLNVAQYCSTDTEPIIMKVNGKKNGIFIGGLSAFPEQAEVLSSGKFKVTKNWVNEHGARIIEVEKVVDGKIKDSGEFVNRNNRTFLISVIDLLIDINRKINRIQKQREPILKQKEEEHQLISEIDEINNKINNLMDNYYGS